MQNDLDFNMESPPLAKGDLGGFLLKRKNGSNLMF